MANNNALLLQAARAVTYLLPCWKY